MITQQIIKDFIVLELEKHGAIKQTDIDTFNFIAEGHIDSISIMKFIIAIENEFNVEITDEEMTSKEFSIVGGIVDIISKKLS
jgi:acyl carrier protein